GAPTMSPRPFVVVADDRDARAEEILRVLRDEYEVDVRRVTNWSGLRKVGHERKNPLHIDVVIVADDLWDDLPPPSLPFNKRVFNLLTLQFATWVNWVIGLLYNRESAFLEHEGAFSLPTPGGYLKDKDELRACLARCKLDRRMESQRPVPPEDPVARLDL